MSREAAAASAVRGNLPIIIIIVIITIIVIIIMMIVIFPQVADGLGLPGESPGRFIFLFFHILSKIQRKETNTNNNTKYEKHKSGHLSYFVFFFFSLLFLSFVQNYFF